MATAQGGLMLALLTFGFLLRFITCKINFYDKSNIRVDDLGYYSSRHLHLLPKCDYVLKALCPYPAGSVKMADHKQKNKDAISKNYLHNGLIIIILMSGAIAINPGPIKCPCGQCGKSVRSNQRVIQCEECQYWQHMKCIDLPLKEYDRLSNASESWYCKPCMLPSFTDSYFETSINNNEEAADCDYLPCHSTTTSGLTDINKDAHDVFEDLAKGRRCNPKSLMCGYLNINSIRNKHEYIRNLVDILFLSETKIDASFPDAQFSIDNFTMWRADRDKFGGGVMVYIRSDLAADRKLQYEFREIESIGVEVTSGNEKWFFGSL
jgi:hypothetical protein